MKPLKRSLVIIRKPGWRRSYRSILALLFFALSACNPDLSTWTRIQESGELRIGLDPTYPPFESLNGTEVQGLDVDLIELITEDLGLEPIYVQFGYDGLYDALATKKVDVLASALVISPEKLRDFAYSKSYFNAGQVLVTNQSRPISDLSELEDKTIAVELGALGHVWAIEWQRKVPDLSIHPYPDAAEALASVSAQQADAAVVDHVGARLFLARAPGLIIIQPPVTEEPYALVVRNEDEELLENLNQSLNRLSAAGALDKVINRWIDQ